MPRSRRDPEGADEQLRVQRVLPLPAGRHSCGDRSSIPSIAQVPSMSSCRKTTMSSAVSMAAVAVAAPRIS